MKYFNLNFGGFYNSEHDQLIDGMLESYFCDENGQPQDLPDNINYQNIFVEYSKQYLIALNTCLLDETGNDCLFHFERLDSPREYNFKTDSIYCAISNQNFKTLKKLFLADSQCIKYINDTSRSRDGFISFYNGIANVESEDDIFLEYVFNYFISMNRDQIFDCLYQGMNILELLYYIDFLDIKRSA